MHTTRRHSDDPWTGARLCAALLAAVCLAFAWAAPADEPAPPAARATASTEEATLTPTLSADEEHEKLFLENRFPSATTCATCHPGHYREWSVSPHSYAQMSPVFNAMHGTILKITNGTNGDFCIRCHTPVGMNLGEPEFMSNIDRHPTSREGVTCIVCHRVNQAYGKLSGRLAIVEGDLFEPVYGPKGKRRAGARDRQQRVPRQHRAGQGRARHPHPGREVLPAVDVGLLRHLPRRQPGERLPPGGGVQRVQDVARSQTGDLLPGLPHGHRAGRRLGLPHEPAAVVGGVPPSRASAPTTCSSDPTTR